MSVVGVFNDVVGVMGISNDLGVLGCVAMSIVALFDDNSLAGGGSFSVSVNIVLDRRCFHVGLDDAGPLLECGRDD